MTREKNQINNNTEFFSFLIYYYLTEVEPRVAAVPNIDSNNKWLQFTEGESIIKQGLVNKRKGLFARKRMLLLTTGPRLFYIDPVQMVKKGEIPITSDLRSEPKNFKYFFVHTVSAKHRNFYTSMFFLIVQRGT